MSVLSLNTKGTEVIIWQAFLIARGYLAGKPDGIFGSKTADATRRFQQANRVSADGIVGFKTLGLARNQGLFNAQPPKTEVKNNVGVTTSPPISSNQVSTANYPDPPSFKPLYGSERDAIFGTIKFTPKDNNGNITILGNWEQENIVSVLIPQLKGVISPYTNKPISGNISLHRKVVDQTKAMFNEFEKQGLTKLLLTFGGSFVPRLVRGSSTQLSNHSYGSAFDINMQWNALNTQPALCGQKGSVRELAALASQFGYYWGGHYQTRKDGMHFEVAKLI